MSHGRPAAVPIEPSLTPDEGWHCSHLYYRFDREVLSRLSPAQRDDGRQQLIACSRSGRRAGPRQRLQTSVVSGHKADFGLMLMDPDPLKIDAVHQAVMASPLGAAITPTYSFVSLSEISEYVPSVEQYAARLVEEGEVEGSDSYQAKVNAYQRREPIMRRQRLTPDFPQWPATCFYPMNKQRVFGENWFTLAFCRTQSHDERACQERHGLCRQGLAADHRRCGSGRLGMGRDAVGRQPAIPDTHRVPDAV